MYWSYRFSIQKLRSEISHTIWYNSIWDESEDLLCITRSSMSTRCPNMKNILICFNYKMIGFDIELICKDQSLDLVGIFIDEVSNFSDFSICKLNQQANFWTNLVSYEDARSHLKCSDFSVFASDTSLPASDLFPRHKVGRMRPTRRWHPVALTSI